MKKIVLAILCISIICLVSCSERKAQSFNAETATQKYYYAMGNSFAQAYTEAYSDMDLEAFSAGILDYREGKVLSQEELVEMVQAYQAEVISAQAAENLSRAEAFLAENGKKEGVVTTASGLQYKVIEEGSGTGPTLTATVLVNYTLTDLDGNVIDSSNGTPISFPLGSVIKGFAEALTCMKAGGRITAWIHPDLGYGKNGGGSIGPQTLLVFDIELISFQEV